MSEPIQVEFAMDAPDPTVPRAVCAELIRRLFADVPDVHTVIVAAVAGSDHGRPMGAVLRVSPRGIHATQFNQEVVRIGGKHEIQAENARYAMWGSMFTGMATAKQCRVIVDDDLPLGALRYPYLSQGHSSLLTLRQHLLETPHTPGVIAALEQLFLPPLAQGQQKNGGYNDPWRSEDQSLLWFYNQHLPPVLTAELAPTTGTADARSTVLTIFTQADSPGSEQLAARSLTLATADFRLELEADGHGTGDVHLAVYERAQTDQHDPHQYAIPALLGRVLLTGTTHSTVAELLVQGGICMRITGTREHLLHQTYAHLRDQTLYHGHRGLPHSALSLVNPIESYAQLLGSPRRVHTSIIHGTMSPENIFIDTPFAEATTAVAWLIDFTATDAGGHVVFDAVTLETAIKTTIFPHWFHSVEDLLLLERALHEALIHPDTCFDRIKDHPKLLQAYDLIASIRRMMLKTLANQQIPPEEYYLGLLGAGLALLKDQSGRQGHQHESDPVPQIPPGIATFLSASFAASVLRQPPGAVLPTSYPRAPQIHPRPIMHPTAPYFEAGRRVAVRQARTSDPIVQIIGHAGTGRLALAQAIAADLQESGYDVLLWPCTQPLTDGDMLRTRIMEGLAFRDADSHPGGGREHTISIGDRALPAIEDLVALLESRGRTLLILNLTRATPQLLSIVSEICVLVQSTGILLISDHRLPEIQRGRELVIPASTRAQVERYLEQRRLRLSTAATANLLTISHGWPLLIAQVLNTVDIRCPDSALWSREIEHLTAIPDITQDAARQIMENFSPAAMNLLQLYSLMIHRDGHAPVSVGAQHLFQAVRGPLGWLELDTRATREYEYVLQTPDLAAFLQVPLLEGFFNRLEVHRIFDQIIAWYSTQGPARLPEIAFYQRMSTAWEQAEATLLALFRMPNLLFSPGCAAIYQDVTAVLERSPLAAADLRVMAGHCAMYLGRFREAERHLEQVVRDRTLTQARRYQISAQLLALYRASSEPHRADDLCTTLKRRAQPATPLYAVCLLHEARQAQFRAPTAALVLLKEGLACLEASKEEWQAEEDFYLEEMVLAYDSLAQVTAGQGDVEDALDLLAQADTLARRQLKSRHLSARISNNIGYVQAYASGTPQDIRSARQRFEDAYKLRKEIGDVIGQIRSGNNLGIQMAELAHDRAGWLAAHALHGDLAQLLAFVDIPDRGIILVSRIETCLRMGAVAEGRQIYERALAYDYDPETTIPLHLNRAKLELWDQQPAACQEYLARTWAILRDAYAPEDHFEWLEHALQCELAFGTPVESDRERVRQLLTERRPGEEQPALLASWSFTHGLYHAVEDNFPAALGLLAASQSHWDAIGYRYRAAIAAVWTVCVQQKMGMPANERSGEQARGRLAPFGATPAAALLAQFAS